MLDFVSDIRRLAEIVDIDNEAKKKGERPESYFLRNGIVTLMTRLLRCSSTHGSLMLQT